MGKKLFTGFTILLITGLFTGWYFFTRESKFLGTSAFRAVPENAALIVRVHNIGNYTLKTRNNPIWKAYSQFPGVSQLYQEIAFADSLFKANEKAKNLFSDKDLTIAFDRKDDLLRTLYLVELASLTEKKVISGLLDKYFQQQRFSLENIKSDGVNLSCYTHGGAKDPRPVFFTFYHGLFLAGSDKGMIMQAISQLDHPSPPGNTVFEKANKTATGSIDLNIYLNHKKLPWFASHLFSETFLEKLKGSAPLADWSELDLTQKSDELLLNGFSFMGDSLNNQLAIFLHQKPDSFKLASILPAETSFFLSYVINDNAKFFSDYEKLPGRSRQTASHTQSLSGTNSHNGIDLQKMVSQNLDGAAAIFFTCPDPVMKEENRYLILKVRSGSAMEREMNPLTLKIPGTKKRERAKDHLLFKMDKETVFKIYKTPVTDFGKRVFGDLFSGVVTSYFTFYDNCLIMGTSNESLERFLRANVLHETLKNDPVYKKSTLGLSEKLNIFLWSSPGRSLPFFREMFDARFYEQLGKYNAEFKKIESAGWQITEENGMNYNLARLKYNPDVPESITSVTWKSKIENDVINRPQFVLNPSDKANPEIVFQDSDLNLILMKSDGTLLWKIKLKSPVRSEVFQLDCFKNGQLQYFFSTDEALHLIGHDGKYIANYPVALRSEATNGVAVVDYDHNKDYRFFIACKDHKICLFDKKGKPVTGWAPAKTEHNVTQPIQYFRAERKDYIVFTDKNRVYLLDHKGKPAATFKGEMTFSHNRLSLQAKSGKTPSRLITTDSKGNVIAIGFDGKAKKVQSGRFSPDHYFIYDDFNSDKQHDYLFFDGDSMVVYDQNSNRTFSRKFNHRVSFPPELFTFPDKSRKIGITDTIDHQLYLFNADGSSYKGFPIDGNSPFAIHFSGELKDGFNLITGSADRYLIQYHIKF